MNLTDSHSHLFLPQFKEDILNVLKRAAARDVRYIFLPNIDTSTIDDMHQLCNQYPRRCFPMMGLHPSSVKEDFEKQLDEISRYLYDNPEYYTAIGETGMDMYHDLTYVEEQRHALQQHIKWAKELNLPLVLHTRGCNYEVYDEIVKQYDESLTGVFHCFDGDINFARKVMELGFYIGIGGVVTFKNSKLPEVVKDIPLKNILLETDAPYLAPHPHRGKRNESSYIYEIASKIALIKGKHIDEVTEKTTENASCLYNITGFLSPYS